MLPSNQSELLIAYSHVITHAAGFIFYFRKLTATLCLSFLEVENVSEKCPQVQKAGMSSKIVWSPLQFFIISILNHSKKTDFIFASYEIKKMDLITTYSFPCFLPYSDIHFVEHFNGLKIKKKYSSFCFQSTVTNDSRFEIVQAIFFQYMATKNIQVLLSSHPYQNFLFFKITFLASRRWHLNLFYIDFFIY